MNFASEQEITPPDDDDKRKEDDELDGDEGRLPRSEDAPGMRPPVLRETGNTGVKGVLADYAAHKEIQRIEAELKNWKLDYMLKKKLTVTSKEDGKKEVEDTEEDKEKSRDKEEEDLISLEEEDDQFFQEYRQKRMMELKSQNPTFGYVKKISRSEYLDAIEKEKPNVFVVVHLYQDYIPACTRMNQCLQTLAIENPTIKFIKILSTEASNSYDDVALPTLIVYKNGDLVSCFVRVTDTIGASFDVDNVTNLLRQHEVLPILK